MSFIPTLTEQQISMIIAGCLLTLSLIYPMIIIFRSRKLVGRADAQDLGFQSAAPSTEELSDWRTFWNALAPHLNELRQRLTRAGIALIIATILSFLVASQLLDLLTVPIGGLSELNAIEVTEPISVYMRVALTSGFVLAMPFIFAQLWLFVAPALRENEFRYIYLLLPFATILFLSGAFFAYFVMLPTAIPFLVNFMNIPSTPRPANYIKFVTSLVFWVGVSFETPLLALILARLGLISADTLIRNWRYAIVIIAVVAAIVTPTVDPVNMALVMAPLIVLYLLSILLAKIAYRERESLA
jgi:sec-independent protein translocase protein TatC